MIKNDTWISVLQMIYHSFVIILYNLNSKRNYDLTIFSYWKKILIDLSIPLRNYNLGSLFISDLNIWSNIIYWISIFYYNLCLCHFYLFFFIWFWYEIYLYDRFSYSISFYINECFNAAFYWEPPGRYTEAQLRNT